MRFDHRPRPRFSQTAALGSKMLGRSRCAPGGNRRYNVPASSMPPDDCVQPRRPQGLQIAFAQQTFDLARRPRFPLLAGKRWRMAIHSEPDTLCRLWVKCSQSFDQLEMSATHPYRSPEPNDVMSAFGKMSSDLGRPTWAQIGRDLSWPRAACLLWSAHCEKADADGAVIIRRAVTVHPSAKSFYTTKTRC